ncbi:MAG: anaerobic ribonucleoside-triphosphate reductase, partial [Clostridia bacterium]
FLEAGLYPYTKRYLGTFANHFSTIGLVGMNEACLNAKWIGKDMTDVMSQTFTKEVLNYMRNRLSDYQVKYGDLFNLEATPAESTSYRLAKHDKAQFPNIITASEACNGTPFYTNSSNLPVGYTEDVFKALDIQDEIQTLYTSGTVFHAFLGQKLTNWQVAANLVRKIAENYKLPYYTISPTYSVCSDHGYIAGEVYTCPECGKKTEVYSRITGYYRPVQNWNDGKTQEYKQRKTYDVAHSELHHEHSEACECHKEESKQETSCNTTAESVQIKPNEMLVFTTKTCPNCKMAKLTLDKAGITYTVIDAEDSKDLTIAYGVRKAPTLLVPNGKSYDRYENVSEIKGFTERYKG